jgi:hypothetical protein
MKKGFTKKEEKYLLDHRLEKPASDLAKEIGCSKSKVSHFFRKRGLKLPPEIREKFRVIKLTGRTTFTPEMDKFLIENYLTMPVKPLGEKIGKSYTGVMIRLRQLGLKIPKDLAAERKKIGWLRKGAPAFNKGMKQTEFLSPEAIQRTKKTRFKKGHIPHNVKPNGYERCTRNGYTEVRVSRGKYRFKHHLIYEKHYGKIPEGMLIRFKDGNTKNFAPSNLEAVSKLEHLQRNWLDYPAPLKKAIILTNKITKEL